MMWIKFYKNIRIMKGINHFVNEFLHSKEREDKKEAQEILKFLEHFKTEQIQNIKTYDEGILIEMGDDAYVDIFRDDISGDYVLDIQTKDGKVLSSVGNTILKRYIEYLYKKLRKALRGELPLLPDDS